MCYIKQSNHRKITSTAQDVLDIAAVFHESRVQLRTSKYADEHSITVDLGIRSGST